MTLCETHQNGSIQWPNCQINKRNVDAVMRRQRFRMNAFNAPYRARFDVYAEHKGKSIEQYKSPPVV